LNTDGIDPSGTNITIRNLTITSYDDAVAVKPANGRYLVAKCAENIYVENVLVYFGVGMTIGTVPPGTALNCIRNVTFRNITFKDPFKAVYVKTNPGVQGSGIIENIVYDGLKVERPLWWAIYIGPQQQKQPDGGGPGCMLYPLVEKCDTEPRITIRNITVKNVDVHGGVFPPGIIRCNETNPCTGFHFENVKVSGWYVNPNVGYITEHVQGTVLNSFPDPGFAADSAAQAASVGQVT
jgi:polygalacturonase